MKKQKFVLPKNASATEFTDSIGDFAEVAAVTETQLSDGLQPFEDFMALLGQEGNVRDMAQSFPAFIKEIPTLDPSVLDEGIKAAKARALAKIGKEELPPITGYFIWSIENVSSNYGYLDFVVRQSKAMLVEGEAQLNRWKTKPGQ